jgi:hypothetical protein
VPARPSRRSLPLLSLDCQWVWRAGHTSAHPRWTSSACALGGLPLAGTALGPAGREGCPAGAMPQAGDQRRQTCSLTRAFDCVTARWPTSAASSHGSCWAAAVCYESDHCLELMLTVFPPLAGVQAHITSTSGNHLAPHFLTVVAARVASSHRRLCWRRQTGHDNHMKFSTLEHVHSNLTH